VSSGPQLSDHDFAALVLLIENGELDDRMIDLITAIDERNERRKSEIIKLVQSVWGPGATIASEEPAVRYDSTPIDAASQVPQSTQAQVTWPEPIESAVGIGDLSPVADPMSTGSDPYGDSDVNIVSTGGQIERFEQ